MPKKKTCFVKHCLNKPSPHRRGLCQRHYADKLKSGAIKLLHDPNRGCKIKGCNNKHEAFGYCNIHFTRFRRHGDPLKTRWAPHGEPAKFIEKAVSYRGNKCLFWPYYCDQHGHAKMAGKNRKPIRVARIVCEATNGKPPKKHGALHSCNNGHLGCITPKHLYWGTQADNVKDMLNAGHGANQCGRYQ